MNKKYLKGLCILALSACAYSKSSIVYADVLEGAVNTDILNVRACPDTSSFIVGQLKNNDKIKILGEDSTWYKIIYNDNEAWVSKEYISVQENTKGEVIASGLNVRNGAGISYKIIGSLNSGDKVSILRKEDNWYNIKYKNSDAWVSSDFVVPMDNSDSGNSNGDNNSTPTNKNYKITADALNIRSGPGTSYGVISSVSYDTIVTASESRAGWLKISNKGVTGWISSDYVTEDNSTSTPPSNDDGSNNTINKTGVVNADVLNVRNGAGTSYTVIDILSNNSTVYVLSEKNGWYNIRIGNTCGWVSAEYISITDDNNTLTPDSIVGKVALVNTSSLNLRSGAGTQYGIVKVLTYGEQLDIVAESNGWIKASISGTTGWLSSEFVNIYDENNIPSGPIVIETPLITSSSSGEYIVSLAEKYLGIPYVWGGTTPSGFDCSGLIQYIYKEIGIYIPRVTYDQVNVGKTITRNNLQPGDLIFFTSEGDPTDIGHVGVYAGNNEFIHAPAPGSVIKYSSLSNSYYNKQYFVSKRIIK